MHTAIFTEPATQRLLAGHAAAAREVGAISGAEAEAWIGEQERRAEAGRLMVAMPMFLAAGGR